MAEELKYKVVLDAQDVPAYLSALKQQIDDVVESSGRGGFGGPSFGNIPSDMQFATPQVRSIAEDLALPSQNFSPLSSYTSQVPELQTMSAYSSQVPDMQSIAAYSSQVPAMMSANYSTLPEFIPMTSDPISMAMPTFEEGKNALTRASELVQSGYYKANTGLESIRSTAELARYNLVKGFDRSLTPASKMSPIQLAIGTATGTGYDPLESTVSRKEWSLEAWQRWEDNKSLGMADWSFSDLALDFGIAGATIGSFGGLAGAGIGAGVGVVAGSAAYLANEVVKPFREEDLFRRNITRGLRNYSRYTIAGSMDFDERAQIADFVAERDVSSDLVGKGISRTDIEGMFNQLLQTDYMQQSINADDMIGKIKDFTKNFTDVMHIFRVSKEEVGKVVDQLNNAGIIDMFGSIGTASKFVEAAGISARIDPNQALQMYQSGAEMLRGTGVAMGAGGDLLVSTLADIKNLLQMGAISNETVRQLGGQEQAAFSLSHQLYQQASSPGGFLIGNAMRQGTYDPSQNLGINYLGGFAGMGNYEDYLQTGIDQLDFMSEQGNVERIGHAQTIGRLKLASDAGLFEDLTLDKAAMHISRTTGVSFPEAQVQVQAAYYAGDNAQKQYSEALETIARREYQDRPSWWAETTDNISNWITKGWRDVFQIRGDYNTELTMEVPEYIRSGLIGKEMAPVFMDMLPEDFSLQVEGFQVYDTSKKYWEDMKSDASFTREGRDWFGKQLRPLETERAPLDVKDWFLLNPAELLGDTVTDAMYFIPNTLLNTAVDFIFPKGDISRGDIENFVEREFDVVLRGAESDNFLQKVYSSVIDTGETDEEVIHKTLEYGVDMLKLSQNFESMEALIKKYNITEKDLEEQARDYKGIERAEDKIPIALAKKQRLDDLRDLTPEQVKEVEREKALIDVGSAREIRTQERVLDEDYKVDTVNDLEVRLQDKIDAGNKLFVSEEEREAKELLMDFNDDRTSILGIKFGKRVLDPQDFIIAESLRHQGKLRDYVLSKDGTDEIYEEIVKLLDAAEVGKEMGEDLFKNVKGTYKASQEHLEKFLEEKEIDQKLDLKNVKKVHAYFEDNPELKKEYLQKIAASGNQADLMLAKTVVDFSNPDTRIEAGMATRYSIEQENLEILRQSAQKLTTMSNEMKTFIRSDGTVDQRAKVDPVLAQINANANNTAQQVQHSNSLLAVLVHYAAKDAGLNMPEKYNAVQIENLVNGQ